MTTKHTPGPWSLNDTASHPWGVECESNIPGMPGKVCAVGYLPNARLIAAAPELLEALEGIMKWWMETSSANDGEDCMPADLFDNALAAINKAKGDVK